MKLLIELKEHFSRQSEKYILAGLLALSLASSLIYYQDRKNLLYADAISRLDISRKVIDNLTPGLAQLGNVWVPLPQILMLPMIWIDELWQTGIAGTVMSAAAFILGGLFIFRSAKILSASNAAAGFSVIIYGLNINLLYLQTTAMSEALFLCTLSASIYYLLYWIKTKNRFYLVPAAISVSAMTLTRYEGLAILISSALMVFVVTLFRYRKRIKAEADTIMYTVLASLGFGLWTLYLAAIFGNPLYWKSYYATPQTTESSAAPIFTQAKPLTAALWQYFTSTTWMVGIIPVAMGIIGIAIMAIRSIKERSWYFMVMLMPLSVFLFLVLTLQRNTPIVQPALTLQNIFSGDTSMQVGFNIRYGLLLLPWFAIMASYLIVFRHSAARLITVGYLTAFFGVQIYSYFIPKYSVIYQIPKRIGPKPYGEMVDWMRKNYDEGLILVSASSHEDQMFEMGLPYRKYIHEGTNKFWKETLDDPPRYATWVILDRGHPQDLVAKKETIQAALDRDYNVVYARDQVKVYKLKHKPYIEIK